MNFLRKRANLEAIYSIDIDFFGDRKLEKGEKYDFLVEGRDRRWTDYDEIKEFLNEAITVDFKKHLIEELEIPIKKIKILTDYSGSIEFIFKIIFGAYSFVSTFKDFHESTDLIKKYSQKFIKKRLNERYGVEDFKVRTYLDYPYGRQLDREIRLERSSLQEKKKFTRDGFFYYLLVSNIVLVILIMILIYKAVSNYYL